MDLARFAIFAGIIIINFHYVTSVSCLIVFIDGAPPSHWSCFGRPKDGALCACSTVVS